jgi:cyclopropane fatty-acyl-phospholipid synthase-like methyltransferase
MTKRISGKEVFKLNAKLGPIWCLRGVNYWRYVEYPWVVNNLSIIREQKLLDVGSSSCSLLPLLLASKRENLIFVTDLDDHVLQHIKLAIKLGLGDEIKTGRFVVEKQDVTALTYQEQAFDRVTAVSLLEHIPDQGDTKAVKEISRVLKPGGLALITVPYNYRYKETFVNKRVYERAYSGEPVFYQRHYDSVSLMERLIEPSGLKVKKVEYFGETGFRFERVWDSLPLAIKAMLGWMRPLFSMLFIRRIDTPSLEGAMAAFLVLEKAV